MVNTCGSEWSRACRLVASKRHWGKSLAISVLPSWSMPLGGTSCVPGTVLGAEGTAVDRDKVPCEWKRCSGRRGQNVSGGDILYVAVEKDLLLMGCVTLRETLSCFVLCTKRELQFLLVFYPSFHHHHTNTNISLS